MKPIKKRQNSPYQLLLPLPFRSASRFEDFIVCGGNDQVYQTLRKACESEPDFSLIYFTGGKNSGKTHLINAFEIAIKQTNTLVDLIRITGKDQEKLPSFLVDTLPSKKKGRKTVLIDDVDEIPSECEEALFNFFNRFTNYGYFFVISSSCSVQQLTFHERVRSRLQSGVCLSIKDMDEPSCIALFKKLAKDKQVLLDERVINYLIRRIDRNPATITSLFTSLEETALRLKRAITIPLAKEILLNRQRRESDDE